jgi:hypothetical protein
MKLTHTLTPGICALFVAQAFAQTSSTPAAAPAQAPALASSVGLMAYPSKGQDAKTQNIDEGECYAWSKQQSGYDPGSPPPTATIAKVEAPPQQANGSRARSAARGAAAGAVVGEIADDDAGKGAAYGAAAGTVAAGHRNREAKRQGDAQADAANQQAQAAADQQNAANAQLKETFKKGMKACLEGKGYTVK